MFKKALFLTLIMVFVFVLSGCDFNSSNANNNENSNKTAVSSQDEDIIDDTDIETEELTAMPTEDVYGEDMTSIDRYPESKRTYYVKDDYETDITYITSDSETKVRDYFLDLLKKDSWENTGVATDYLDFEKGDTDNPEMLTIYFTPYENSDLLEYEMVYSPPLTEEELADLNDEDIVDTEE
ncbi:MAG: hypothetical protein V1898_04255 [Patescibacteria group bacterium]